MRIVVTGSPATGKTSVALALARLLDCPYASANEIAMEIGAVKKQKSGNDFVVDLKKLQRAMRTVFKSQKNIVAEGHLLCEFSLPAGAVLVLRCDPRVLLKRYARRGYSRRKAAANALAEALDYCLVNAEEHYGARRVVQLNASKKLSAKNILRRLRARESDFVDWSGLLLVQPLAGLLAREKGL